MKKRAKFKIFIGLTLLSFTVGAQWPHKLLSSNEVLECLNDVQMCSTHEINGLLASKKSWHLGAKKRITHAQKVLEEVRRIGESILIKGNILLQTDPYHSLGQIYHMYGSKVLEKQQKYNIDSTFLILGEESPVYTKLTRYDFVAHSKVFEVGDESKEKTQKWIKSEQLYEVLSLSEKLEEMFALKSNKTPVTQALSFSDLNLSLSEFFQIEDCPKLVSKRIEQKMGSFEIDIQNDDVLFKNESKVKSLLAPDSNMGALKIQCQRVENENELSSDYDSKRHEMRLRYYEKGAKVKIAWPSQLVPY